MYFMALTRKNQLKGCLIPDDTIGETCTRVSGFVDVTCGITDGGSCHGLHCPR